MGLVAQILDRLNDQYKLYPDNHRQGLLYTRDLYEKNKKGEDYYFGYLTELYEDLQGAERDHWRQGVANLSEIQDPIKSVIIAALTHRPDPIEIHWGWISGAPPEGIVSSPINKGVLIVFDPTTPKYHVIIFGYKPMLTEEQAERLARRAERNGKKEK